MFFKNLKIFSAYSLVEILVVLGIFSILSIVATQSIFLVLRGSKKSESVVNVKQELDYAADIIERQLQNSKKIIVEPSSSSCTPGGTATVSAGFISQSGSRGDITCLDMPGKNLYTGGTDVRVASSSGIPISYKYRLTSNKIAISACKFTCFKEGNKINMLFEITASAKGISQVEGASVTTSRRFFVSGSERY